MVGYKQKKALAIWPSSDHCIEYHWYNNIRCFREPVQATIENDNSIVKHVLDYLWYS